MCLKSHFFGGFSKHMWLLAIKRVVKEGEVRGIGTDLRCRVATSARR